MAKDEKTADAPKTETKAEAKKEAPPARQLYVGTRAARDGTTYNEFQKIVLDNPGKTEEELKKLIPGKWQAPNSEKFRKNPDSFIQGYLSAGVRKGFFVTDAAKAAEKVPTEPTDAATGGTKEVKLTRAGRELIETIIKADEHRGEDGFVNRAKVDELLGRPMAQLGKGIVKLTTDGLIEQGERVEGETTVQTVKVTDKGRELAATGDDVTVEDKGGPQEATPATEPVTDGDDADVTEPSGAETAAADVEAPEEA